MTALPAGTVTFLFTDIEDSTRLLADLGQETFLRCLSEHEFLMRTAIDQQGGTVVKPDGGAFFAVFTTPTQCVNAAIEAQRLLQAHRWPDDADVRVKMGLHTGSGVVTGNDYTGIDVHKAARVAATAHGGQVLMSGATAETVRGVLPDGTGLRDLGIHALKDFDAEPLFQIIFAGLPNEFPPLATSADHPTNLPASLSSFVGRLAEVRAVEDLLATTRLVTVTGVAGAGKTRLALEVAERQLPEFPDGVWFIDLSVVSDPERIAVRAADSIGVRERPGIGVSETITRHLATKRALLVVDNCEHLIDGAAAFITRVLSAAPACRVLATSRQVLRLSGEVAYRLTSMSLPDGQQGSLGETWEASDAIRLFVDRAAAVQPGFRITEGNIADVAEICRRLEGMPLAIELAAARLRTASPRQIAGHIAQSLQGATGEIQASAPRQQTLAAAIDWSYQLLDETEQSVFRRLSVFRGGFTMDAAQQVCADADLGSIEVLQAISALVDKSLVTAHVGGESSRYRLLEMLRRFADDRLTTSGEAAKVRLRHAELFVSFAERAEPNIRGVDEIGVRHSVDRELDNLGAAMSWSLESGHQELGLRIAGAIWRFWWATFRFTAGEQALTSVLRIDGGVDDIVRAKALVGLGTLRTYTDDPAGAEPLLEEAIALYREAEVCGVSDEILRLGFPAALVSLGTNLWQYGQEFDRARELWEEALVVARRVGDTAAESSALGNLAEAAAMSGDVEKARAGYTASIEASRRLQSTHRIVEAIFLSAVFELSVDEPSTVVSLLDEAVVLARAGDLSFWVEFGQAMRAVALHDLGEDGAIDQFSRHAERLLADEDFLSTFYYQLPLILWRADLEAGRGNNRTAARLLGCISRIEEEHSPMERIFEASRRSRLERGLRDQLGGAEFEAEVSRGRALSVAEGVLIADGV